MMSFSPAQLERQTNETDRALIERCRRRRFKKEQLVARAQLLLDDAPSPDRV